MPLVQRPFSDSAHDGHAVRCVLDSERVVVDVRALGGDVLMPRRRWLNLQLLPDVVLDAQICARERVAPHLEHPPEGCVCLPVRLELDREVEPQRRHLPERLDVHHRRRWPDGLHAQVVAAEEALHNARLLLRHRRHVGKEEGHVELRCRTIGNIPQNQVVCLCYQHVLLAHAPPPLVGLEHRIERPRPVDHLETACCVLPRLLDHNRWHRRHQAVGCGARRGEQPREARHLGARAASLHLLKVVVHDLRLPLLVHRRLRGQDHVEGPAPLGAFGARLDELAPGQVVGRGALSVGNRQPVLRAVEQPFGTQCWRAPADTWILQRRTRMLCRFER
mmetsp:Transcript_57735/g.132594  ORF Transcript_57735/g.132594 Transcript_57735/m.132594 type:complete len:334 (-) Transcript_57735:272-1273(-)